MSVEIVVKPSSASIDERLDEAGFGWFQIRLCLLCGMGYFAVGSELLSMVMAQSGLMETFAITDAMTFSWLPFFANLASFTGAILVGKWADIVGRKWPFIVCIALSSMFGIACAFAASFAWLIAFRSVVGFGLGGLTVIDYIVLVECTPSSWRNFASQTVFVAGCMGVIYVAVLGLCPLENLSEEIPAWRVLLFFGALPLLGTVALRLWVSTDTPKFLQTRQNFEQADQLLCLIAATNKQVPRLHFGVASMPVEQTFSPIDKKSAFQAIFRSKHTWPLAGVWIVQSLVYWGLTIFLPVILNDAGIDPSLGLFFMGIAELPGVVIATVIASRWSRPVAIVFCLGMSILGAAWTGSAVVCQFSAAVSVAGASVFYMFLIPIWGLLFVLTPETYPVETRGVATGFHHMCKSVPSLVAPFVAAKLLDALGSLLMFVWAGVLLIGISCAFMLIQVLLPRGTTDYKL